MAGGDTRAPSFDAALRAIVECTGSTGATFMDDLVRALCRALGVRCAMVGAFADEGKTRVRSLAVAVNGEIAPPMEYALAGTPCAQVVSSGVCFHRNRSPGSSPTTSSSSTWAPRATSACRCARRTAKVLGILVVIHDAAIDETIAPDAILTIFAARAATELERLQVERELRDGGRLRRVFERLPLPASLSDPAGRREFVNPAYDRLIGLSIEDAPSVADAIRKLVVDEAELPPGGG
jgi:PAS domain-containing protein